jgi:hypothetical protein
MIACGKRPFRPVQKFLRRYRSSFVRDDGAHVSNVGADSALSTGAIDLINQVKQLAGQLTQAGLIKTEQNQVTTSANSKLTKDADSRDR